MASRLFAYRYSSLATRKVLLNRSTRIVPTRPSGFATPQKWYSKIIKKPPVAGQNSQNAEPHSLSARLKKLTREYGYTVMGVYLALSVIDFPLCFLAVKLLGEKRVAHAEHVVFNGARNAFYKLFPNAPGKEEDEKAIVSDYAPDQGTDAVSEVDATIWTQLALAFVIHKSFIFIRVPLTAAVTPKVVKTLRSWGYDIGRKKKQMSRPNST
ncbi:unnamed protein product [Periconia digitata]|uniref:DUF1279 domain-containing protein n=1 Tax=Periconia digitata TaxID=1303443 RepID=A0A9W4UJS0_9PLEO|nr:unnamed protein product [Periconia digitata]